MIDRLQTIGFIDETSTCDKCGYIDHYNGYRSKLW